MLPTRKSQKRHFIFSAGVGFRPIGLPAAGRIWEGNTERDIWFSLLGSASDLLHTAAGSIWEAFGKDLESIWEAFGKHLGGPGIEDIRILDLGFRILDYGSWYLGSWIPAFWIWGHRFWIPAFRDLRSWILDYSIPRLSDPDQICFTHSPLSEMPSSRILFR